MAVKVCNCFLYMTITRACFFNFAVFGMCGGIRVQGNASLRGGNESFKSKFFNEIEI